MKISQFFLIMTLCLGLNSIDACQLEGLTSRPGTDVARSPLLVHYHENTGDNKDVESFIGTALFGENWKRDLEVAKEVVKIGDFKACCPASYGIVQLRICIEAQQKNRQDVLRFLQDHSCYKEPKFTTWR